MPRTTIGGPNTVRPYRKIVASILASGLLAACAGVKSTRYTHKNADLGAIKTAAVLPFSSLVDERTAGEKAQRIFLVELLAIGAVDVVEPGQVAKVLAAEHVETTDRLGPAELQRIGQALKVDGLFLGTVVD